MAPCKGSCLLMQTISLQQTGNQSGWGANHSVNSFWHWGFRPPGKSLSSFGSHRIPTRWLPGRISWIMRTLSFRNLMVRKAILRSICFFDSMSPYATMLTCIKESSKTQTDRGYTWYVNLKPGTMPTWRTLSHNSTPHFLCRSSVLLAQRLLWLNWCFYVNKRTSLILYYNHLGAGFILK